MPTTLSQAVPSLGVGNVNALGHYQAFNNYIVWVAMDTGLGHFTIPASIYRAARNTATSPAGNYSFFSAANFASTMTKVTTAALAAATGSSGATGAAAGVKSSAGIDLSNNVGRYGRTVLAGVLSALLALARVVFVAAAAASSGSSASLRHGP